MTSPKKQKSRHCVFDASFLEYSLNVNTPHKHYLWEEYDFTYPKLDDFALPILKYGKNSFLWKRDLSRFFLQLPLDPSDYDKVGCIWRGQLLLFTSYVWGTRHAGMNGQRVTNMVSAIHRSFGASPELCSLYMNSSSQTLNSLSETLNSASISLTSEPFNTLNYSDDFSDVEPTLERATLYWLE